MAIASMAVVQSQEKTFDYVGVLGCITRNGTSQNDADRQRQD
jgi:hypothetical protein